MNDLIEMEIVMKLIAFFSCVPSFAFLLISQTIAGDVDRCGPLSDVEFETLDSVRSVSFPTNYLPEDADLSHYRNGPVKSLKLKVAFPDVFWPENASLKSKSIPMIVTTELAIKDRQMPIYQLPNGWGLSNCKIKTDNQKIVFSINDDYKTIPSTIQFEIFDSDGKRIVERWEERGDFLSSQGIIISNDFYPSDRITENITNTCPSNNRTFAGNDGNLSKKHSQRAQYIAHFPRNDKTIYTKRKYNKKYKKNVEINKYKNTDSKYDFAKIYQIRTKHETVTALSYDNHFRPQRGTRPLIGRYVCAFCHTYFFQSSGLLAVTDNLAIAQRIHEFDPRREMPTSTMKWNELTLSSQELFPTNSEIVKNEREEFSHNFSDFLNTCIKG